MRNPYDKLVSEYFWQSKRITGDISFEQFVTDYVVPRIKKSKKTDLFDDHYTAQYKFITDDNGKNIIDFVGRFENMATDFDQVCKTAGIKAKLRHLNQTKHKPYQQYYTDQTKDLVNQLYQQDLEFFGYQF